MAITPYMTKSGKRYRVEVYREGERIAAKAGFTNQQDAKKWEARALVRAEKQGAIGTDFLRLATAYLDDMKERRQHNTVQYKIAALRRFLSFMGGRFSLELLRSSQISAYLVARKNATGPKAANRDLVELRAVMNWAIRKRLYHDNPFLPFEKFPEKKFVRRVPTAEEIDAVLAVATQEQKDFLDILRYTGARLSEVCSLCWRDVDFQRNTITFWTRKRRGGDLEPGTLAMPQVLRNVLAARKADPAAHQVFVFVGRDGRQFTKNSVRLWLPTLCKEANVDPPFTAHSVRHYFATLLKDSGVITPFQIQAALRHKNLSTTEKYLHELSVDRGVAALLDGKHDA